MGAFSRASETPKREDSRAKGERGTQKRRQRGLFPKDQIVGISVNRITKG